MILHAGFFEPPGVFHPAPVAGMVVEEALRPASGFGLGQVLVGQPGNHRDEGFRLPGEPQSEIVSGLLPSADIGV